MKRRQLFRRAAELLAGAAAAAVLPAVTQQAAAAVPALPAPAPPVSMGMDAWTKTYQHQEYALGIKIHS